MSLNDELDALLDSPLLKEVDWDFLRSTMDASDAREISGTAQRTRMNEYIRHSCYGHSVVNVFRDSWSPDYKEIVRAAAKKLKVKTYDHQSVDDIEGRVLQEVIEAAKAKFIKEKKEKGEDGEEEWNRVERKAFDELVAEGGIPSADAQVLKGLAPGSVMAMIVAGRLSGIAVYLWANKIFFGISRALGLGVGVAVAGPIIGKALSVLLGPAGWVLTGVWLIYEIGNTNWRKTISAVVSIAMLRRKLEYQNNAGAEAGTHVFAASDS